MARSDSKVFITCAVTGLGHLPLTPDQIVENAVGAAEAGAAMLHLIARNPDDGSPTADHAVFDRIVPRVRDRTDAVINITTGGSARVTLDERLAYPLQLEPEMCSLNFSIYPAARKIQTWKYPWETPYMEGMIFRNTFRDIKHILRLLGDGCGTRFKSECYDVGHLHNLRHFVDERLIKPLFFIQTVLGGLGPDPENLMVMRQTADRLFGRENYRFSVLGAGRHQMPLLTMGAIMGGNVRVGPKDSLFLGRGQLAQACAQQVHKIRRILSELSLDIATPGDARHMLAMRRSPSRA